MPHIICDSTLTVYHDIIMIKDRYSKRPYLDKLGYPLGLY